MDLVRITYHRGNKEELLEAIVTSKQAEDIRMLRPHIYIVKCEPASEKSTRDYILK